MILFIIIIFIILLLIFLIFKSQHENFIECPNKYSSLCAQQSYDSDSKSWCAQKSFDIPCTDVENNYIQQQCLNSQSLTTDNSYLTDAKAWCTHPQEEYYY